jgi:hypothetical protein
MNALKCMLYIKALQDISLHSCCNISAPIALVATELLAQLHTLRALLLFAQLRC